MANEFKIKLDDKPALLNLKNTNVPAFKEIVGTFVNLMETAAQKGWLELPKAIHTSLTFPEVVNGVLNGVMTTKEIDLAAYATLEYDLHPLSLLSDKRKNIITGEEETYNWKSHFSLDTNEVSQEALEHIIRKILYLVRWFDIESVSKSLVTNQFPVIDDKDIMKLPFQPALMYQQRTMGDLHVGKFLHDIGALNCGIIKQDIYKCPACKIGELKDIHTELNHHLKVCPRCNAGFKVEE